MDGTGWKDFLLSPQGRVRRYSYNMFYLATMVVAIIAFGFDYLQFGQAVFEKNGPQLYSNITSLLLLWPTLVITIKRLHDINYRGWWLLVGFLAPVALALVAGLIAVVYLMAMGQQAATLPGLTILVVILVVLSMAVMLAFFIILSVRKGTIGPNRFGVDPLQNLSDEKILVSEGV
ncbi:MAG TPA: DUF805 domain-containing protein [Alphaproteobacteria bacterium]